MKGAAAPQGRRQRLFDKEGSGGATTKAEPAAQRRRQNRRHNEEGSGGATTKAAAARQSAAAR
jgi:hypothetical protein